MQLACYMRSPPLISVIVAVRNAEKTVVRTLESVLVQTYANKEIILIDGASTDATLQFVRPYQKRLGAFLTEPDNGIADAYNKGVSLARGEWIFFLNADDIFFSETTLADCFEINKFDGYDLVIGKVIADNGRVFNGKLGWKLLIRNQVHHQAIFYRAEILKNFPYNTQYRRYGHDHEHNLLLWRLNLCVKYIELPIAFWATGGISDGAIWKDYTEEFKIRRNVMGLIGWPFNFFTVFRFLAKRVILRWIR
jgi:putative colanic acid biosynthesis glycosyltransferase